MKRKLIMILALSATLTMLAACSNANENSQAELDNDLVITESTSAVTESEVKQETSVSEETYKESTTDTSAESSETISDLPVEYEDIEKQISDEEINTLLQGRRQINSILMYSSLDYDTESKVAVNGFDYYRVIDEKYDEWNEWTDYVKSIYVNEASEMIFNDLKIIEINGKTYTNDGSAGNSISDEYTYEIVSETNDTAIILLKNTDNFTSETIETKIVLEKTSNGWRIKNY